MPLHRTLCALSLTVLMAAASGLASALPKQPQASKPQASQGAHRPQPPRAHQRADEQRALSDSVRRAERAGQVLSAERVQYDGRDLNRVKIVDDQGRVRVYWDDPKAARQQQGQAQRTRHDDDADPNL